MRAYDKEFQARTRARIDLFNSQLELHDSLICRAATELVSRPPPSLNAICRGGSPHPSPPAPGAYAPLTGAGCGAPLELIVEEVVVEAVAELLAEMAVDVVLLALRVA